MTRYPYLMRCVECHGNLYIKGTTYRGDDSIYKCRNCGREYTMPI